MNGPTDENVYWTFDDDGNLGSNCSTPIVVNGRVYFSSMNGYIYALDAETSAIFWRTSTRDMSGSVCTPAFSNDTLFVGDASGYFVALDVMDGHELWNFYTEGSIESSPLIHNGSVIFGSLDGNLYSLNAENGEMNWDFTTEGSIYSSPASANGLVFFGSDDNKVYAVKEDSGELAWEFTTREMVRSSPSYYNGMIYIGSNDHLLYALHADSGTKAWEYVTGGDIDASPAIADDKIYFGSEDGFLYCLKTSDGHKVWARNHTDSGRFSSAAVTENKLVYVVSGDGVIHGISNYSGKNVWIYTYKNEMNGRISSPAVGHEKMMYVHIGSELYCFGKVNEPPTLTFRPFPSTEINYYINIFWQVRDPEFDDCVVHIYVDDNQDPLDGMTLVEGNISYPYTSRWHCADVPKATYYIVGIADDGYDQNIVYSEPLTVVDPQSSNYHLMIGAPDIERIKGEKAEFAVYFGGGVDWLTVIIDGEHIDKKILRETRVQWEINNYDLSFRWDSTDYKNGKYSITVIAYSEDETGELIWVNEKKVKFDIRNEIIPVGNLFISTVIGFLLIIGLSWFMDQAPINQGAINQRAINQRAINQGAINQGSINLEFIDHGIGNGDKNSDDWIERNPKVDEGEPSLFNPGFRVPIAIVLLIIGYAYSLKAPHPSFFDYLRFNIEPLDLHSLLIEPLEFLLIEHLFSVVVPVSVALAVVLSGHLALEMFLNSKYSAESTLRVDRYGLVVFFITSSLFASPFGFPLRSVSDINDRKTYEPKLAEYYQVRDGKLGLARILGTLILLIPFYIFLQIWQIMGQVGIMITLMAAFFFSIPLKNHEGKMVMGWNKKVGGFMVALTCLVFFGWHMLIIPDMGIIVIGGLAFFSLAHLMKKENEAVDALEIM